ncbi:hypothetical protein QWY99_03440 [Flavobacterium branchiarum]|uniref:Tetratricopeptide repeat protein n=1 Tax=Flavobacterium branchiarum TaxID=1114870 RepID=A0ABV5FN73_9FLAO|nr:hypothetical protein [Flavobacterium branchiarum]MDN3672122.1 hypothetical protein [Flavobacterium branchiarum]
MKNTYHIVTILLITSLLSCQSKSESKKNLEKERIADRPECEVIYNKYIEKASKMENDSAIYFLNKSINCDPANDGYKFSKAQFFVDKQEYQEALNQLNEIKADSIDPTLRLFSSVLKLKLNSDDADKDLSDVYSKIAKIKKPNSSNVFYKLALDNYFKGKDYALEQLKFCKKIYTTDYDKQNLDVLESYINTDNKRNVLFKIFNIR